MQKQNQTRLFHEKTTHRAKTALRQPFCSLVHQRRVLEPLLAQQRRGWGHRGEPWTRGLEDLPFSTRLAVPHGSARKCWLHLVDFYLSMLTSCCAARCFLMMDASLCFSIVGLSRPEIPECVQYWQLARKAFQVSSAGFVTSGGQQGLGFRWNARRRGLLSLRLYWN